MWLQQSGQGGEREEWRAGKGWGQVVQGLGDIGEDMGFTPREVGAPEGCKRRRVPSPPLKMPQGPDSGAHRRPLVATEGRTDCGVTVGVRDRRDQSGGDWPRPGAR